MEDVHDSLTPTSCYMNLPLNNVIHRFTFNVEQAFSLCIFFLHVTFLYFPHIESTACYPHLGFNSYVAFSCLLMSCPYNNVTSQLKICIYLEYYIITTSYYMNLPINNVIHRFTFNVEQAFSLCIFFLHVTFLYFPHID